MFAEHEETTPEQRGGTRGWEGLLLFPEGFFALWNLPGATLLYPLPPVLVPACDRYYGLNCLLSAPILKTTEVQVQAQESDRPGFNDQAVTPSL